MPLIRCWATMPTTTEDRAPAVGYWRFAPTLGRTIAGDPDEVVLPGVVVARAVEGRADVALAPSEAAWCYRVDWVFAGVRQVTEFVIVPDAAGPLDLTDLVRVDPATLEPTAVPEAAWWAAWQAMASGTYLVPDPSNPGLYLPTAGTAMVKDPTHDGLYTIGTWA